MELPGDDCPLDGAARPRHPLVDSLDRDLFEDEPWHVLRAIDVPDSRIAGHDHRRGTLLAGEPGPVRVRDVSVLVVEDVLPEVPDRTVVGLSVVVERDLLDAPVEIGDVLGDTRLDRLTFGPLDDPRLGKKRGLRVELLPVDPPVQHGRVEIADREERIRDGSRVGERRGDDVDPLARRSDRKRSQVCRLELGRRRLRDRRLARAPAAIAGCIGHERRRQAEDDHDDDEHRCTRHEGLLWGEGPPSPNGSQTAGTNHGSGFG